jgi:hypothetical protein
MRAMVLSVLAAGLLLACAGCASQPVQGNNVRLSNQYFGNLGVWGNGNQVNVQPGSRLEKVSIWGNSNSVDVADNVTLYKIEFFGKNNIVTLPENAVVRVNNVGANQIIRRPRNMVPMDQLTPAGAPPGYLPPPATPPANDNRTQPPAP